MNYVYDILLNFNKEFYDFYEWNPNDEIIHIRKIPILKVSNKDFKNFKNSLVHFDNNFTSKIYNKTEKFSKAKPGSLNYAFLVSNEKETIALKLNKNGINTYKSSLLLDEGEEISDIAYDLPITNINYKIIKTNNEENFKTRKEKEIEKEIIIKLNKLYKAKEIEKLKFIYLDCFNKEEKNIDKILNILKKETLNNPKNCQKIYSFFKIIEQK